MSEEDRPGKMSGRDFDKLFKEDLAKEEQTDTLIRLVNSLGHERRAVVMSEVIRIGAWRQRELHDVAISINKKLDLSHLKDVIFHTLESKSSNEVPEVVRAVVDRLVGAGLLPPGFFSRGVPSSQEDPGEEQWKTGYSVEVHFTDKAYGVIEEIKDKSRTVGSLSAVLTQALAFEKWYRDAIAAGNHVYVDRGRGKFLEVKRP